MQNGSSKLLAISKANDIGFSNYCIKVMINSNGFEFGGLYVCLQSLGTPIVLDCIFYILYFR
jgi:hypothetical protein